MKFAKLICLLACLHLCAEEIPARFQLQLSFYTWPVEGILCSETEIAPLPPLFLRSGERWERVELSRGRQTTPVIYAGDEAPVLYRLQHVPAQGDQPARLQPVPHLQLTSPDRIRQAVVVLFPDRVNDEGEWMHLLVPNGSLDVPPGHLRFLNTSLEPVVVSLGEALMELAPGRFATVSPESLTGERVRLRLYQRDTDRGTRLLHTSQYRPCPEAANLFVIHERGNRRRLAVLHLLDPQ